jgi:chemotaxis protein CheD
MGQIVVGIADCATSNETGAVLATFALGSCIAVTIWDPAARIGGLLHFMLPDSALDAARGRSNPFVYADTGVPRLIQKCVALGADPRRLIVRAAGGAGVLDRTGVFSIGAKNDQMLRRALRASALTLASSAVGGTVSRSLRLEIGTGRCWVREGMGESIELPLTPEGRRP